MSDDTWWLDVTELKEAQLNIINLPKDGSHLLVGPPGSGKTNLLLLRAAYLARSGKPNCVILTFNRSLKEFVSRGAPHYQLEPAKIQTIHSWVFRLLREQIMISRDELPKELMEARREMAKRLSEVVSARPKLKGSVECIFVDEAQDCLPEEIELFFALGKDVFLAGDKQQRIYGVDDVITPLMTRTGVTFHELTHHYRNGIQICIVADAIGKTSGNPDIRPTCNYVEAANRSKVEFFKLDSIEKQCERLIAKLTQEIKAYPNELLGVACPLNTDVSVVTEAIKGSPLLPKLIEGNDFSDDDEGRCIFVSSLHDIKGLEFRTMHLVGMESVWKMRDQQKRLSFTAVTRAKTLLSVYFSGSIPGYLQQAQAVIDPPEAPAVGSLFPGRK